MEWLARVGVSPVLEVLNIASFLSSFLSRAHRPPGSFCFGTVAAAATKKAGLQHAGQSSAVLKVSVAVGLDTLDTQAGVACHHLTYLSHAYRATQPLKV